MDRTKTNTIVSGGLSRFFETVETDNAHWIPQWRVTRQRKDGIKLTNIQPAGMCIGAPNWIDDYISAIYDFLLEKLVRGSKWSIGTRKYSQCNDECLTDSTSKGFGKQWWMLYNNNTRNSLGKWQFNNNVGEYYKDVDSTVD
jgi:hypothetical protein